MEKINPKVTFNTDWFYEDGEEPKNCGICGKPIGGGILVTEWEGRHYSSKPIKWWHGACYTNKYHPLISPMMLAMQSFSYS